MSESGVSRRAGSSEVDNNSLPKTASVKKGKGGRKVMFPSAEEKKQRNRDSQAAFRERRKEHIAELEKIVQAQKEKLQQSQNAQSSAKEEVLILKYKNSLLERILLEQGIDVNAELNNILVFPPRAPAKHVRKERTLARPERDARPLSTSSKKSTSTTSSPKPSTPCCHCSGSRTQLTPETHANTPPTVIESVSTPQNVIYPRASKRRRYDPSNVQKFHKHPNISIPPVQTHRTSSRPQSAHYPGKYSRHSLSASP